MKIKKYKLVIVVSEFNRSVSDALLDGAERSFNDNNGEDLHIFRVPGAFEIASTVKMAAQELNPDAIVALGSIIRGETKHFDFISAECARSLQDLTLKLDIPIMFGVLTTENKNQALDRAQKKDKGYEVMSGAFKMIQTFKEIKEFS